MFRQIGPTEILLILGVVLLLFGGRKLPELARGSGRALRIFKSEVKSLDDGSEDDSDERKDAKDPKGRSDSEQRALDATEDGEASRPTAQSTPRRDSSPAEG